MGIDQALLEDHRHYQDPVQGISEEFIRPVIGGSPTVAVLSRPIGDSHVSTGWVVCHSFGLEQIHLSRLDVITARALSAAGFPVLRFHGRGYGDSEGTSEDIGLSSHLKDASDAVALLKGQPGVEQVGVLGARFGGLVAALVADRHDLPLAALWEPVIRGSQYMRDFLRTRLFAEIVIKAEGGGSSEMARIQDEMNARGWTDIKGFRLTRRAHDEIAQVDLTADLTRFRGRALLGAISRTGAPGAALQRLAARLTELGGDGEVQVLQDPLAAQFGQFRFQTVDGGRGKRDTQLELNESIAAATAAWAARVHQTTEVFP